MTNDIFSLAEKESAIRQLLEHKTIDLSQLSLPIFKPSSEYRIRTIQPNVDTTWIMKAVNPVVKRATKLGFATNVTPGLYEALLNAFQHGNKEDITKPIDFAYRFQKGDLDVIVMDQGGQIDARFAAYILLYRAHELSRIPDFYTFSGSIPTGNHHGVGTRLIHAYFDKVTYHYAQSGGLAVHMLKSK